MKDASIVLFGDSYTAGRLPHSQQDGAFREALAVPLYADHSKSGSTAQQWAADFEDRLSAVISSCADVAVGSLGGNDVFAALADGIIQPAERITAAAALFHCLMRLRRKTRIILMLYPDPFAGRRLDATALHRDLVMSISSVAALANSITGNISLLDLSTVLRPEHFDGTDIHPNAAGYQAMAAAVTDLIDRL